MKKLGLTIFWFVFSVLFLLQAVIEGACDWFNIRFGVSFEEIIFTITSSLSGADIDFLDEAVSFTLPYLTTALFALFFILIIDVVLQKTTIKLRVKIVKLEFPLHLSSLYKPLCMICVVLMFANALNYALTSLSLDTYISRKMQSTTIYEDYYVNPNEVSIICEDTPKNIIYIYLESMESTYASIEDGGAQSTNYIPNLTQMASNYTSFSDTSLLGGGHATSGASWTMGALFATTTGIPFSYPIDHTTADQDDIFASGATTGVTSLGDILEAQGYQQVFLCGSDASFAGRKSYFQQHGNYQILDYYYAIEKDYIAPDYHVWWGYEDAKLYDIAKQEILELAESHAPFNFTFLTVDTHHIDGYVCEYCNELADNQLGNVLLCADTLVYDFVVWCQEQDFYENTIIVITGDHYRMDSSLVAEAEEKGTRRVYNCIINSDKEAVLGTQNRTFATLDFFPTVLSAMGFTIEGDRLGLGTDLYSATPTLSEELGIDVFDAELGKYSDFFTRNFY